MFFSYAIIPLFTLFFPPSVIGVPVLVSRGPNPSSRPSAPGQGLNRQSPFEYPETYRSDYRHAYKSEEGDVEIPDPYIWLEDENDEKTQDWIRDQNTFTDEYLAQYPHTEELRKLFVERTNPAKFDPPMVEPDGHWYWYYKGGDQPQRVLYRSKSTELPQSDFEQNGELFFDPNLLSSKGTTFINFYQISPSGKYFAYCIGDLATAGADTCTIYIRETRKPLNRPIQSDNPDPGRLADQISVTFSQIAWIGDEGFLYKSDNYKILYHELGKSDDITVFESDEPLGIEISYPEQRYLILSTYTEEFATNGVWIVELHPNIRIGPSMEWSKIVESYDASYEYLFNDGSAFYFSTNDQAPTKRLVRFDLEAKQKGMQEIIPKREDATLAQVAGIPGGFALVYKLPDKKMLYSYSSADQESHKLTGDFVGDIPIDSIGDISIHGRPTDQSFFATFSGFTTPGIIFKYDVTATQDITQTHYRTMTVDGLDPQSFEKIDDEYTSSDGTRVPIVIVRHKATQRNGKAPALQYGYGGYGIAILQHFSARLLSAIQAYGIIFAVPIIRGGSDKGEDWHNQAVKGNKVRAFEDFIAATDYLVKNGWAAPGRVAITGVSHGGYIAASCAQRAPAGTYGAVLLDVAVLDLIKLGDSKSEFGDPNDPSEFRSVLSISPYQNIPVDTEMPPLLARTADHDDRVSSYQTTKYVAKWQYLAGINKSPHPALLRYAFDSGHSAGTSTERQINAQVEMWSFFGLTMKLEWKEGLRGI